MKKIMFIIVSLLLPLSLYAQMGISFAPGEISFGNFEIGQTYDLSKLTTFKVVNKSYKPVSVEVSPYSLPNVYKKEFQPIPSLQWVKVLTPVLKDLKPKKEYSVKAQITIPNDKKYLGKSFYFFLQAKTISKSFMSLGANSRILFKVKKDVTGEKPDYKSLAKFKVTPGRIYININKLDPKTLYNAVKVQNTSKKKITFELILTTPGKAGQRLESGYKEFPDIKLIQPAEKKFSIKPGKSRKTSLRVLLKDNKVLKGKQYHLIMKVRTIGEKITEEKFVPIFINIKK